MPVGRSTQTFTIALRKVKTALRLPPHIVTLASAFWLLTWPAKLSTYLVPSDWLVRAMGEDTGLEPATSPLDEQQTRHAHDIADAFALASRYTVLRDACLAQALVARLIMSMTRTPHAICLGVNRPDTGKPIEAHAYVMAGGIVICGGKDLHKYTLVRSFRSR